MWSFNIGNYLIKRQSETHILMKINESIVLKKLQINNPVLIKNEKGLMARFRTMIIA